MRRGPLRPVLLGCSICLQGLGSPELVAGSREVAVEIRAFDVAARDGRVYVGDTSGLTVYTIDETGRPEAMGQVGLPGSVRGVALRGEQAFLAVGAQGLFVVQVAEPERMRIVSRYDPPGPVEQVLVREDGTAFLAEDRDGLRVLDLRDPERPRRLARVTTRGQLRALALEGDWLATAEGTGAARLFDVSDASRPRERSELQEAIGARDVALREGLLFVAAGREGLLIYRPDDSRRPLARVGALSSASSVTLRGPWALVANGGHGLQIVNVADPAAPREVATLRIPDHPPLRAIAAEGDRLYLAADVGGLAVADLADARSPKLLYPPTRKMRVRLRED
jgi:hypothetical protein